MPAIICRPSLVLGLTTAARHWLLVFTVWLVSLVAFAPASMILDGAVGAALGRLPEGFEPPAGDVEILIKGAIADVLAPVAVAVGCGIAVMWFFTVLWHAGLARFQVWDGGAPPKTARVLGLGFGAWWKYCRLSLFSLAVLLSLLSVVWFPIGLGIKAAYTAMAEDRMVLLIGVGLILSPVMKFVVWAATLRGAWELARPTSDSAVLAWFRGLAGAFGQPVPTFGILLTLGLGQAVLAFLPAFLPMVVPILRGSTAGTMVSAASMLGASFLVVALFAAFAPVSDS